VVVGRGHGPGPVVDLFVGGSGDAVIFETRVAAAACIGQHGAQIFLRQFHADVAIEIPVGRIARISLAGAPDLLARLAVTPENGGTGGREIRRVDGKARARLAIHEAVGVHDEPAEVCLLQDGIDARDIAALGQPNSPRVAAEALAVLVAADEDLCAHRLGDDLHEREEPVRGGAGDDFDDAVLLELGKGADDIAADFLPVEMQGVAE